MSGEGLAAQEASRSAAPDPATKNKKQRTDANDELVRNAVSTFVLTRDGGPVPLRLGENEIGRALLGPGRPTVSRRQVTLKVDTHDVQVRSDGANPTCVRAASSSPWATIAKGETAVLPSGGQIALDCKRVEGSVLTLERLDPWAASSAVMIAPPLASPASPEATTAATEAADAAPIPVVAALPPAATALPLAADAPMPAAAFEPCIDAKITDGARTYAWPWTKWTAGLPGTVTYADLHAKAATYFPKLAPATFELTYMDKEESITLATDDCVSYMVEKALAGSPSSSVLLTVAPVTQPPTPAVQPPQPPAQPLPPAQPPLAPQGQPPQPQQQPAQPPQPPTQQLAAEPQPGPGTAAGSKRKRKRDKAELKVLPPGWKRQGHTDGRGREFKRFLVSLTVTLTLTLTLTLSLTLTPNPAALQPCLTSPSPARPRLRQGVAEGLGPLFQSRLPGEHGGHLGLFPGRGPRGVCPRRLGGGSVPHERGAQPRGDQREAPPRGQPRHTPRPVRRGLLEHRAS